MTSRFLDDTKIYREYLIHSDIRYCVQQSTIKNVFVEAFHVVALFRVG